MNLRLHAARASASLLAALAAAVLLPACASPDMAGAAHSALPMAAPSAPRPAGEHTLADWWLRFNDPALSALVTQALQANTGVRSAQAELLRSRAQIDVQRAALGPSLGASASVQGSQVGRHDASERFQAGLNASWEADVFGRQRSALQASVAQAEAAQSSLAHVQVALAAEVALAYIELRGLQRRLEIARDHFTIQAQTLQLVRWRNQAGLVSGLDVEQAAAAHAQTGAQIPALQVGIEQALHRLALLSAQPAAALRSTLAQSGAPIPQVADELALSFPTQTLRQRADVRSAEHRIEAALARVTQAEAARYPSFQLNGSMGLNALTLGTLTQGASLVNLLLASVSLPLLDAGANSARVRVQQAELEQARIDHQAVVLSALQEVEDALVALQGNRDRLRHLQTAATAAANAERLARQRYAGGLIDFLSVLDAQRTLLSAQDALQSTRAGLSADHVRLYQALGGGWEPDAALEQPVHSAR